MLGSVRSVLVLTVVCIVLSETGWAQKAEVRTVETSANRRVLEVTAGWAEPLKTTLDSARANRLTLSLVQSLRMGLWSTSERVPLHDLSSPRVRVLSADFEEVDLPASEPTGAWFQDLTSPVAEVVGVGMERKKPTGTLSIRLFAYDVSRGSLRRYRRILVEISLPAGNAAKVAASFVNPHLTVAHSVLQDGILFKIPVTEEGIYKIDRAFLAAVGAAIGLSPDDIEPDRLQVLGNGGAPVPAANDAPRLPDLTENPVFVRGGGDGSFDAGDVLLFYAGGPKGWSYDAGRGAWTHYVHPFSNENYYFLKVATTSGLRVGKEAFPAVSGPPVLAQVTGRFFKDFDEVMWSKDHGSGHTWVSNQIRSGGARQLLQDQILPGLATGDLVFDIRGAIASNPVATLNFTANGTTLGQLRAPFPIGRQAEDPAAVPVSGQFVQPVAAGATVDLAMQLLQQINEPQAAADWVRIFYPQDLRPTDGVLRFATPAGRTGWMELVLAGFGAEPQVWDVTAPGSIRRLGVQSAGGTFRVRVQVLDRPLELIAFREDAALSLDPETVTQVANQDLHGDPSLPDMVIITPDVFLEQANDLAAYRRTGGLNVRVTRIDEIYNEFSGGLPDMRAPRDYLKFLYDRAPDEASLLRYVLFFGDGHFDYRGISATSGEMNNWLLPYETEESFIPDKSFTSDDYFGLLDDNEGVWFYNNFNTVSNERMDVGIGRFPVQTPAEAQVLVDKIKRYESPETYGPWRSRYTFVADDGPTGLAGTQNDNDLHMQNVDQVAELIRGGLFPSLNVQKIYAESFERVFLNGFRIPEAKREINAALNAGTLLFNYSGHGGPDGLAQEELFTREDAEALTNRDRLTIFMTATCSFGWWDIENEQSGAEVLILNPNGGAVAMLTTVRLVYTSGDTTSLNAGLNRAINQALFQMDEAGLPRRLGDVMRDTKNTRVGLQGNSRKFNLLGDPALRLGLPASRAQVDQINQVDLAQQEARMRALDRVTLSGTVRTPDGFVDETFTGSVDVSVFDAARRVPIIKQVYMPQPFYTVREDLIWRGEVRVDQGRFAATFVVPKDISYSNEPGRVTVYVSSDQAQALGFSEHFIVGGTSDNPPLDAVGPQLSLFLNDTTFVSGSLTTPEPELIVKLFDESGINTVGAGVGHEMLLVLNGDEGRAVDISSAFQSAENSFQRGEVRWPLSRQEPGIHSLKVRAWDVLNNSGEAMLEYVVTPDEALEVRNVYNYPNPMNRHTRFVFEHNQPPGTPAQVQVRIYTLNGRPVRTIPSEEALPTGVLTGGPVQVEWDGRDDDLDRVPTGIYLYKVRIEAERADGGRDVVERIEKLAVIR